MKKLITLFLVLTGIVLDASAGETMWLRSSLHGGSWKENLTAFQFDCVWDGTHSQDVYTLTIDGDKLESGKDFYFRLFRNKSDFETCPSGDKNYVYKFPDGNNETYSATSGNEYHGTNGAFGIEHSKINAKSYTITVYMKYNDPWEYYIKVEIGDVPVTISSYGVSTFCPACPLDFTGTGISANLVTAAENGVLTKKSITKVPANTGLLLTGTAGTVDVPSTLTSAAESATGNMLVGVTSDTHIGTTTDSYTNFILTVNKLGGNVPTPKFYRVNVDYGNTVLANRAYLQILTSEVSAREFFWFDEDETTTGIDKVAENQQAAEYYNLSGQRVAQPVKGLYIVNGKKVIIK